MQASAERCPAILEIPGRSDAEKALAAARPGGRRFFSFAAAFLADSAVSILDEGDWRAADTVLLAFFQDLTAKLPAHDRIYRWTGASLLVLMERSASQETVQRDMDGLAVTGKREVFPLGQGCTPEQLRHCIDLFVARNL